MHVFGGMSPIVVDNLLDGPKIPLLLVHLAHCSPPTTNRTDLCIQWLAEDTMEEALQAMPDIAALDLLSLKSLT